VLWEEVVEDLGPLAQVVVGVEACIVEGLGVGGSDAVNGGEVVEALRFARRCVWFNGVLGRGLGPGGAG
jgi:hypothetical protein